MFPFCFFECPPPPRNKISLEARDLTYIRCIRLFIHYVNLLIYTCISFSAVSNEGQCAPFSTLFFSLTIQYVLVFVLDLGYP